MNKFTLFAKNIILAAHDALFPKCCVGCRRAGSYLCPACELTIPRQGRYHGSALIVASYSHPLVRQLVWLLKYRGIRDIAPICARWIYDELLDELAEAAAFREFSGKIVVIPVPLSKKRKRQRGFNQAEIISQALAASDPQLFRCETENLVKIKETPSQVKTKNRAERLNNLKEAFLVRDRRQLRGKTIILLDDVSTTGTTLAEAEKALSRAKPRRVIKVAVAGD